MFKTSKILSLPLLLLVLTVNALPSYTLHSGDTPPSILRWNGRIIKVAISTSLIEAPSNITIGSDVEGAVRRSLVAWEAVSDIRFEVVDSDLQSISRSGASGDGVNLITIASTPENVLLFSKDPTGVSAATRVFYNRRGMITEADVAINPYQQFSTDGTIGTYDLESTLTHEIGHMLGLDHSMVPGATMYENYGRNGLFGMPNFGARTISGVDIAALRGLYGSVFDDEECCETVDGKMVDSEGKGFLGGKVWLENVLTGEVAAAGGTNTDGAFSLAGLPAGNYNVFFRGENSGVSGAIGEIALPAANSEKLKVVAEPQRSAFAIKYIGINGELSEQPVILNSGKTFHVYFGGSDFDPSLSRIGTNSPYFEIDHSTLVKHDYGKGIVVFSVDVRVSPAARNGVYSVYLESATGERDYLPGGLVIESFNNPWSRFTSQTF